MWRGGVQARVIILGLDVFFLLMLRPLEVELQDGVINFTSVIFWCSSIGSGEDGNAS